MGLREAPEDRLAAGSTLWKAAAVSFQAQGAGVGGPGDPGAPLWLLLSAWPPRPLLGNPSKAPSIGVHAPWVTLASVGVGSLHTGAVADLIIRLQQLLLDGASSSPAGTVVWIGVRG